MIKTLIIDYIAKPLSVSMVNYNFFSSLVICKTIVGLYSFPGLPRKKAGLMEKKTGSHPRLAVSKKEDFALRGEKRKTLED
jgi:hypothetical protein